MVKKQDRKVQKALYEMFSAKVLAIANSYTSIPNENKGNEAEENIKVNIASQQPLPINNSVLAAEKVNITNLITFQYLKKKQSIQTLKTHNRRKEKSRLHKC